MSSPHADRPSPAPPSQEVHRLTLASRDFLWAVGSLCNLRRKPFDAALVQRAFPPPHTPVVLAEALRSLDLEVYLEARSSTDLAACRLPRLVFLTIDGEGDGAGGSVAAPTIAPALLARIESDRVLVFLAGTNEPQVMPRSAFDCRYVGWSRDADRAVMPATDPDADEAPGGFGPFQQVNRLDHVEPVRAVAK